MKRAHSTQARSAVETKRRRQDGYSLLWLLIILALVSLAALGAISMEDPEAISLPAFGIAAAIAAAGLAVEFRYDRYEFLTISTGLCLVGAFCCAIPVALGEEEHPLALASAVFLAVGFVVCAVALYKLKNAEETLPNPLLERFDKKQLSEVDGVQFATKHSDLKIPAGGEFLVDLYCQNTMSAERTVTLQLKAQAGLGRGGHLVHDKSTTLLLPAGAAGVLRIPVSAHPKARGSYPISVEPSVSGKGGLRWRVLRARPFTKKVSGAAQLAGLFFGIFFWGGGISLKLKVVKNKNWKEMPVEEASPSRTRLLWEPDAALLLQLAS